MGEEGLEHPPFPSGKPKVDGTGGSKSGNIGAGSGPPTHTTDPELAAVVAAWSDLPRAIRTSIVAMIGASGGGSGGGGR
jgi:hypothetical protein